MLNKVVIEMGLSDYTVIKSECQSCQCMLAKIQQLYKFLKIMLSSDSGSIMRPDVQVNSFQSSCDSVSMVNHSTRFYFHNYKFLYHFASCSVSICYLLLVNIMFHFFLASTEPLQFWTPSFLTSARTWSSHHAIGLLLVALLIIIFSILHFTFTDHHNLIAFTYLILFSPARISFISWSF